MARAFVPEQFCDRVVVELADAQGPGLRAGELIGLARELGAVGVAEDQLGARAGEQVEGLIVGEQRQVGVGEPVEAGPEAGRVGAELEPTLALEPRKRRVGGRRVDAARG